MTYVEEKDPGWNSTDVDVDVEQGQVHDSNAVLNDASAQGDSFFARCQAFAGKFGVEQRGIERVPTDERINSNMSEVGTLVCIS